MMSSSDPVFLTNGSGITLEEHCARAYEWWKRIGSPKRVLAPMVEQSELPFRMLAREHGANLCVTPMVHARLFSECQSDSERSRHFETCSEDRPLVVQFCGNDGATILKAAQLVESVCDSVDLNLGCPQGIAKRGNYGAYLLEEQEVVLDIVRTVSAKLKVPFTVKIRLLPDREETIGYAQRLVLAGASAITVHGRNKDQRQQRTGTPDWDMIRRIKAAVGVPVVANGGISSPEDIEKCLLDVGCDGVMVSEMSLVSPDVFRPLGAPRVPIDSIAQRYLELAIQYKHLVNEPHQPARAHLFKMLFPALQMHPDIRDLLAKSSDLNEMQKLALQLAESGWENALASRDPNSWLSASWYFRHREGRMALCPLAVDGTEKSQARSLDGQRDALQVVSDDAKRLAEEYQKALTGESGANSKDRNRLKKHLQRAEKQKKKILRRIARLEAGDTGDDEDADGGDGENENDGEQCACDEVAVASKKMKTEHSHAADQAAE